MVGNCSSTVFLSCLSFLVDACSILLERAGTVGLFRKPGSLPRIKTLRVRCGIPGVSGCRAHIVKVFRGFSSYKDDCSLHSALISFQF